MKAQFVLAPDAEVRHATADLLTAPQAAREAHGAPLAFASHALGMMQSFSAQNVIMRY